MKPLGRTTVRLFTILPIVLGGLIAFKVLELAGMFSGFSPVAHAQTPPKSPLLGKGAVKPAGACDASAAIAQAAGLSQSEVRVLQSLSARRAELEQREVELDTREKLLAAAEGKMDTRLTELKSLKGQIEGLLGQVDNKRVAQIDSLVRVYEKMKPKDSARIFESLDEDLAVQVAGKMKDQAVAAMLAAMSPEKARKLTTRLANRTPPTPTL